MTTLIAIPILGLLVLVQSAFASRVPLLHGTTDLVLLALLAWALQKRVQTAWRWVIIGGLLVNLVSSLPPLIPLVGYALSTGFALLLRKRVWQVPLLAMFAATFTGTLITQGVALAALILTGHPIPVWEAFDLVFLPSALLNLVFAIPAYTLVGDLANWLYPEEIEV
jgi:cell shape-determining protein MreD